MSEFKTIEPKPGVIILPIKVHEGATRWQYADEILIHMDDFGKPLQVDEITCQVQILGISTELTEEQCAELLPVTSNGASSKKLYEDFMGNVHVLFSAKESFASFMQANEMYTVNPYGEEPINVGGYFGGDMIVRHIVSEQQQRHVLWQEAEANTGKWLILKLEKVIEKEDRLRAFVNHQAIEERNTGAKMFMDKPDRWYDKLTFICENAHISSKYLKSEALMGNICLSCMKHVFLCAPETTEEEIKALMV